MIEKFIMPVLTEVGKGLAEGLKEGIKGSMEKISEGVKEKYLQKETPPINEVSENIPSELKEISNKVTEIENTIDFQPENVVADTEKIKIDIQSIEGKLNTFLNEFHKNMQDKVSTGTHVDHIVSNGVDIVKDVLTYKEDLMGRLKEAGLDVDKIMDNVNSNQSFSDVGDGYDESDFDESE